MIYLYLYFFVQNDKVEQCPAIIIATLILVDITFAIMTDQRHLKKILML